MQKHKPSARAEIVTRRTYSRPLEDGSDNFESWDQIIDRVVAHQTWLWRRAKGSPLTAENLAELEEMRQLMLNRVISSSGRTLWLGGTNIAKTRESSMFNCSFLQVKTVHDIVDALWLLMQGCGVGFEPIVGSLHGFFKHIPIMEVIRSERTIADWEAGNKGVQDNVETFDPVSGTWTIKVGDSAAAWSKSLGKMMSSKYPAKKFVLDLSEIRSAGIRLKGYGWISSGDSQIATAYMAIFEILNRNEDKLLTRIDIMDVVNWMGSILSSRRSAEICLIPYGDPEWEEFAVAKREWWVSNPQRVQSNNSLTFATKPLRSELEHIFGLMAEAGGSEPAFINAQEARRKAPWFYGSNPCCEILLGDKSFCNLVEVDIAKLRDAADMGRALWIAGRANYRQTCVNLKDGILQEAWHQNNEMLRLCGIGLTGIAQRDDLSEEQIQLMRKVAKDAAYAMAEELGTPRPKNVTTVKPSGTLSKIMDTTEGVHLPLGKYIFNHIIFGKFDPVIDKLRAANYYIFQHPGQEEAVIVRFPVKWDNVHFDVVDGTPVNLESAITQLERYKKWQVHWCDQNVSNTISYSPDEVPAIIDWFMENWNIYVGVSFLYRANPTMTAKDLGYLYLPQEVVTQATYEEYTSTLLEVDLNVHSDAAIDSGDECTTGACPVK